MTGIKLQKTFILSAILLGCLSFILTDCSNDDKFIPDRPVYIRRYLNAYKLVTPGSYLYIDKRQVEKDMIGYGGILIVMAFDGQYYAFDLACPHEKSSSVKIGAPNEKLICKCPKCGEEFDVSWGAGMPTKGISKGYLKSYNVSVDEFNYITVTN